jgi:hypothetical protein
LVNFTEKGYVRMSVSVLASAPWAMQHQFYFFGVVLPEELSQNQLLSLAVLPPTTPQTSPM